MSGKCINHTFKCRGIGYGYLQHEGKQVLAHRLAYCRAHSLSLEDISGQVVRHKCDNPKCVNPDHLEIGSQADNMTDKVQRGRVLRGEHIGNSKLTQDQVSEIKRLYKKRSKAFNQYQLAKRFGVSQSQISMIVGGKRWSHTEGDAA